MVNGFDTAILKFFADLATPAWLDAFMLFWTNYVQQALMVLVIVLMFFKKTRKAGITGFIAMFLSPLIIEGFLKNMIGRVRPYDQFEWAKLLGDPSETFSFPSGHASFAFALATGLSFGQKKWIKIALFASAALTAFTRVYISIHWTTDVICGAALGITCGFIAKFIVDNVSKLLANRKAKKTA